MIFILVGFHIVLASFAPIIYRLVKRHIVFVAASAPAVTVIWAAFFAPRIVAGQPYIENLDFAPSLGFQLSFRADAFALLMCFVTSTLGVLLFAYSYFYFYRFEEDLARFTGWMLVFGGSMLRPGPRIQKLDTHSQRRSRRRYRRPENRYQRT